VKEPTKFRYYTLCPFCGAVHDGASNVSSNDAPSDGDVTLCIDCGEWGIFAPVVGMLRKPTDAEYEFLGTDKDARKVREAWVLLQKIKQHKKEATQPKV
jgi:hypothetical protein